MGYVMWLKGLVILATGAIAEAALAPAPAPAALAGGTLAPGWFPAAEGATCAATCTSAGLKNAYFSSLAAGNPPPVTAICAAEVEGYGYVSGWQYAGSANEQVCHVSYQNQTISATTYGCLCLQQQQSQGIFNSQNGTQGCAQACNTLFPDANGQLNQGRAVPTDTQLNDYACLPFTDIGQLNRFGYTQPGASSSQPIPCTAVQGNQTVTTNNYSCFCIFSPPVGFRPQQGSAALSVSNSG